MPFPRIPVGSTPGKVAATTTLLYRSTDQSGMTLTDEYVEFVERLPKAELHCHLAGTIRPATLLELGEKHGVDLPVDDEAGAAEFYAFDSLAEFLDILDTCVSVLQEPEDFERVVVEYTEEATRQNVRHLELFTTFELHRSRGIPWEVYAEGLAAGRERALESADLDLTFLACIDRRVDPDVGVELVERAHDSCEETGIVGIGLDSQERGFPAHRHQPAFERASELGFHRVAHAGEEVGPGSVWDTLAALDPERIDHGVYAVEDEILLEYLAREAIPLTVCPASNVALEFGRYEAHPFGDLLAADLFLTVNSDDPPMFGADLTENYLGVAEAFDLSVTEVTHLARNSFEATFADSGRTATMLAQFDDDVRTLRSELGV